MLARFALSVLLVLGVCFSSANGQATQQDQPSLIASGKIRVEPAAFRTTPKSPESVEELKEAVRLLSRRIGELESQSDDPTKPPAENSDSENEIDERLSKLEDGFEAQGKAVEKLEDAAPGYVVHGHKKPKMKFFGRIHEDYWAFPHVPETIFPVEAGGNPQDRFIFRRMRLGVSGDLNDNMFYKFEGEFAGGIDPSYRDAYLGFKHLPLFNTVIIGNQKRPYGLDHLNSSRHNVFIERPFIVEAFNQDSRRLGISSNGYSEDEGWNWRYGFWNQQLTQTRSGYIGDHYQPEFAARLARTAWYDESSGGRGYAHFAVSGSAGVPDGRDGTLNNQARYRTRPESRTTSRWLDTGSIAGANANYLMGFESAINIGSFNWTSEYLRTFVDRRDTVGEDVAFDGVYTQVSYLLTGEHHPWNRQMGTLGRLKPFENFFMIRDCNCERQMGLGAWEIAFRYSHADLNSYDIRGGNADSYTFGMNWYWNPYARMQFNYILGDLHSGRDDLGHGDYQIAGIRLMVDF